LSNCWLRSLYPKSAVEEGALQKIRLVDSDVADHLRAALRASRALSHLRTAQPIRGVKADRGLGSQGTQPRPDLVKQQLADLAIRQSGESLCQDSGDQHGGGEPLHGVAEAQAPPLFLDQFPDVQFLSPACSVRSDRKSRPEGCALPKISFQDRTNFPHAPYSVRVKQNTETIECPLCSGAGALTRAEILDRLGAKDFARVAQLSAEEAFRLLQRKQSEDQQSVWLRFESELAKRTAEIEQHYRDELRTVGGRIEELESAARIAEELHALDVQLGHSDSDARLLAAQSRNADLSRRVEDCLREVAELRERNHELETEMAKVARVGKREELDFADEVRSWAGISVSEKLPKNGDFILAYRDPSGTPLEPRMVVDNKDKMSVSEGDIRKLIRDAKERRSAVGIIVAREESQLRQVDRERRWGQEDGVWVLRTTRRWLPRDLEVLRPVFERMRTEGPDFLPKNSALAEEVRRTFADLDEVERELGKASKAIDAASGLTAKYRGRLQALCDNATAPKMPPKPQQDGRVRQTAGA
jgi:hypothetical protein